LTASILTSEPVDDDAVLHPYLGLPAAMASTWLGRHILHGAAFLDGGGAIALLGDKEAGKSSTLASALDLGRQALSDDVLILDGATLFSGPRCIDLRADAAVALGGEPLGIVGNRHRWRRRPTAGPAQAELRGVVHLEWGESLDVEPLDPGDRLRGLIASSFPLPRPGDELKLLALASLPTWRLSRPRGIEHLERSTRALLEALG
jgi:hypothetical protein